VDTTALTELIEPVAAVGAAVFFAASKAGRGIRLHTASGGRWYGAVHAHPPASRGSVCGHRAVTNARGPSDPKIERASDLQLHL